VVVRVIKFISFIGLLLICSFSTFCSSKTELERLCERHFDLQKEVEERREACADSVAGRDMSRSRYQCDLQSIASAIADWKYNDEMLRKYRGEEVYDMMRIVEKKRNEKK